MYRSFFLPKLYSHVTDIQEVSKAYHIERFTRLFALTAINTLLLVNNLKNALSDIKNLGWA